tara:strand:- start:88 stop:669 length:582 start_codon:yes stop_codon:yes gene_type:complete
MELYKFGIKFFTEPELNIQVNEFIPEFHHWIQTDAVQNHLLIDVVDYSHISDGPGIMLIAHEGQFSFDLESELPGFMYQRRTEIEGDFSQRLASVFSTTAKAVRQLERNSLGKTLQFKSNEFRFIANDRLAAENSDEKQNLYKESVHTFIQRKFQGSKIEMDNFSSKYERLAFNVKAQEDINFLMSTEEGNNE